MYDMAFEAAHQDVLTYADSNQRNGVFNQPPTETRQDHRHRHRAEGTRRSSPGSATSKQIGVDKLQSVRETLADLVCDREEINAHLTASITMAQTSPAGLLMPHQSLLYAGRVFACPQLPAMMHVARELRGGQICVKPNVAAFEAEGFGGWLKKFYTLNENWQADDRRKILAFARDLLHSLYAGHRLAFAQAPNSTTSRPSITASTSAVRASSCARPRICRRA